MYIRMMRLDDMCMTWVLIMFSFSLHTPQGIISLNCFLSEKVTHNDNQEGHENERNDTFSI